MSHDFTLDDLKKSLAGSSAAIRRITEYQPAGGTGDKVFPPTYEGGQYATEKRLIDGAVVDCVLLDSVQSQANRMEQVLLEAWETGQISLPVVSVNFSGTAVSSVGKITSLDAPHRLADAILRDSIYEKKPFRESDLGKRLDDVSMRNAAFLFGLCPTALVFGMWDSAGPKGGGGAKFPRAIVSEMVGIDTNVGVKTSSRIDPLGIMLKAGPVYMSSSGGWTLNENEAKRDSKNKVKEYRPSEINHGNVTPTIAAGGVTIRKALQTTVISLAAIRRLRFPLNAESKPLKEINLAAQCALASLALCAATLSSEQGCDLRSRCVLVPVEALNWEILNKPGDAPFKFSLSAQQSIDLMNQAVKEAISQGLPWHEQEIELKPSDSLVLLVKKSHELMASQIEEAD